MQLYDLQAAATQTAQDPVAWYNVVGQFKLECAKFSKAWAQLVSNQGFIATHPTLQAEYNQLVALGNSIKSKIQYATQLIDETVNMAGSVWGSISNTFTSIFGGIEPERPQLGFLVLIPAAVIAASVAAIAYFVSQAYQFQQKINQVKAMEAQGVSAQQAYATVGANAQPGILSQVKGIALPIAGVVGLVAVLHMIESRRRA